MKQSLNNNSRFVATGILNKVLNGSGYSNGLVNETFENGELNDKDQRLVVQIVYGTLQHKITLDYFLEPYIKQQKRIDDWVLNLLRISVYQMYYLDRVPDRAIFYDATQIAKEVGNLGISKFVTAVLRNIQRNGFRKFDQTDENERLSTEYSVPVWIVKQLKQELGLDKLISILKSINSTPRASARVNTSKMTVKALQKELEHDGTETQQSEVSPVGLVSDHGFFAGTQWYQAGFMTVQDESSMLVAPALQVEHDSQVLDACAAPGGKTTHIAQYLGDDGHITALDLHQNKLRLIKNNAHRMGFAEKISRKALDARKAQTAFADESFDRILVDAPCSGFGLMRRKPEIRYLRQYEDILNLAQVQHDILNAVAPLVKVNGIMVYSTCTIFDEENEQVVKQFLAEHKNYELIGVRTDYALEKIHRDKFIKIYPDDYGTDGFFIACLKRME